jgi:hypothetical protein
MPSRHVRNYRARYDCLGSDPPLLLIAPLPTANYARYFRTAPNNVRVVTNVDHNVHTIPTESSSCTTRAQSAMWGESTAYRKSETSPDLAEI